MKKLQTKLTQILASLSLVMASKTANSACVWFTYQPKLPDSVKKLRKF